MNTMPRQRLERWFYDSEGVAVCSVCAEGDEEIMRWPSHLIEIPLDEDDGTYCEACGRRPLVVRLVS